MFPSLANEYYDSQQEERHNRDHRRSSSSRRKRSGSVSHHQSGHPSSVVALALGCEPEDFSSSIEMDLTQIRKKLRALRETGASKEVILDTIELLQQISDIYFEAMAEMLDTADTAELYTVSAKTLTELKPLRIALEKKSEETQFTWAGWHVPTKEDKKESHGSERRGRSETRRSSVSGYHNESPPEYDRTEIYGPRFRDPFVNPIQEQNEDCSSEKWQHHKDSKTDSNHSSRSSSRKSSYQNVYELEGEGVVEPQHVDKQKYQFEKKHHKYLRPDPPSSSSKESKHRRSSSNDSDYKREESKFSKLKWPACLVIGAESSKGIVVHA
ncbi:hypothetical protein TWF694_003587 [Orbilia ellipsospora]|uniref:Uncharacterized protein n=1 Tax=Orbilia ellipsospora TaxID=2528407 RepID=A0AAV9WZV2_9PEZI